MKKRIFYGFAVFFVIIALVMAACDISTQGPVIPADDEKEFVQYSSDGRYLTIDLNGGGPARSMSRALTNPFARVNHDFFEVVFYYTPVAANPSGAQISRTSWSRGEGAALSVFRGNDPAVGINYGSVDFRLSEAGSSGPDTGAAILFVGKRDIGRSTLLAVGTLVGSINSDGTAGTNTIITDKTAKVTFEIATLASGIWPDVANLNSRSSFYTIKDPRAGDTPYVFDSSGIAAISGGSTITPGDGTNFIVQKIRDVNFPLFMLASDSVPATIRYYAAKFSFATATGAGIVTSASSKHHINEVIKGIVVTEPSGHKYVDDELTPNIIKSGNKIFGSTSVIGVRVEMANNRTAGANLVPEAYFRITVPGGIGGLIAFNFNIPVYAITALSADNGTGPFLWFVEPGIENQFLDNGEDLGGAILLGIGDPGQVEVGTGFASTP